MKIAPSIWKALYRIMARDLPWIIHDATKLLMASSMPEIMSGPSTHLCEGSRKFWNSNSDSECEDLGDADLLAQRAIHQTMTAAMATTVVPRPYPLTKAALAMKSTPPL